MKDEELNKKLWNLIEQIRDDWENLHPIAVCAIKLNRHIVKWYEFWGPDEIDYENVSSYSAKSEKIDLLMNDFYEIYEAPKGYTIVRKDFIRNRAIVSKMIIEEQYKNKKIRIPAITIFGENLTPVPILCKNRKERDEMFITFTDENFVPLFDNKSSHIRKDFFKFLIMVGIDENKLECELVFSVFPKLALVLTYSEKEFFNLGIRQIKNFIEEWLEDTVEDKKILVVQKVKV